MALRGELHDFFWSAKSDPDRKRNMRLGDSGTSNQDKRRHGSLCRQKLCIISTSFFSNHGSLVEGSPRCEPCARQYSHHDGHGHRRPISQRQLTCWLPYREQQHSPWCPSPACEIHRPRRYPPLIGLPWQQPLLSPRHRQRWHRLCFPRVICVRARHEARRQCLCQRPPAPVPRRPQVQRQALCRREPSAMSAPGQVQWCGL